MTGTIGNGTGPKIREKHELQSYSSLHPLLEFVEIPRASSANVMWQHWLQRGHLSSGNFSSGSTSTMN
jgi:hypothetical protein